MILFFFLSHFIQIAFNLNRFNLDSSFNIGTFNFYGAYSKVGHYIYCCLPAKISFTPFDLNLIYDDINLCRPSLCP